MQIDLNKLKKKDPEKAQQIADLLGVDLDAIKTKKRQVKKLPKSLRQEQVEALLSAINLDTYNGVRQRAIIGSMLKAGLRVSEVENMTTPDVDLIKKQFFIQLGKGGKDRVVPFGDELAFWLSEWDAVRPDSEWFFCTNQGTQPQQRNIRDMLARIAKKAKVYIQDGRRKKLPSPHTLRHTYATTCLDAGLSIRDVQELLGHTSIGTTEKYLHINQAELDAKVKAMDRKQPPGE